MNDSSVGKHEPLFSVVIATYGRNSLIESTLRSVDNQVVDDFEVLLISDGPSDISLKNLVQEFGEKYQLHELPQRTRSQSAPNNLGRTLAKGKYIAYLGHDDIWLPNHLDCLKKVFDSDSDVTFAVSGTLTIGPSGAESEFTCVTGIFSDEDPNVPRDHFFPPSSIAHRTSSVTEIPPWPAPLETRRPVDSSFQISCFSLGLKFRSTEVITVLKFNSALRYLSYLEPEEVEQRKAFELSCNASALNLFLREHVSFAKQNGTFMNIGHPNGGMFQEGEILENNEKTRGISLLKPEMISIPVTSEIEDGAGGFDWYPREGMSPNTWRWSGPSPRPRFPIPFATKNKARVTFEISRFSSPEIKDSLQLFCQGKPLEFSVADDEVSGHTFVTFDIQLNPEIQTVIEFRMNETYRPNNNSVVEDERKLGICLTRLSVVPIKD